MRDKFRGMITRVASALLLMVIAFVIAKPLYAQRPMNNNSGMGNSNPLFNNSNNDQQFGSNPYANPEEQDDEDQEGKGADSTKDEKKIRKPLESYFFSDSIRALPNFKWSIKREYNQVDIMPLDTTLYDFRIDYPYRRIGVGDMSLGGLGQASQPINYFLRSESNDFAFSKVFDTYTYNMENVPFFNVKTPFTHLNYAESGQKTYREANFSLTHAQNISPSTGFNVEYKSRGTKGLYTRQDTKNHNLSVALSHTGKRYSVHAGFINNHITAEENGGVVGAWAIRDTTFEMAVGTPFKLASAQAQNIYRNTSFFAEQSYGIPLEPVTESDFSISHLSAVYIGHSIEYNRWSKTYKDVYSTYIDERGDRDEESGAYVPVEKGYYENWYINPRSTRDTLFESRLSNRVYIQAQPWDRNGVIGTLSGGLGLDLYTFSQFEMGSYLSGKLLKEKFTSYFAYGSIDGKIKRYVDWGAKLKYYPSEYRSGDMSAEANIALKAYIQNRPIILSGRLSVDRRSPSYWQENLFSNHFVWFTPLAKENETRLEVNFEIPEYALKLSAWQGVLSNKIYYDESSEVAQNIGEVSLTSLYADKDFRINGFHLNHRVLMQWSTNQRVVPVPLFSAYLSYYYEFWVTKNVLKAQLGVDGRYTSSYYMPGYNPALSVFYNQREVQMGDYPEMDIYIAGKWKRMRLYFKYQHVNNGLFGNNDYFSVANYPHNPGMFKIGFSWGFYD